MVAEQFIVKHREFSLAKQTTLAVLQVPRDVIQKSIPFLLF